MMMKFAASLRGGQIEGIAGAHLINSSFKVSLRSAFSQRISDRLGIVGSWIRQGDRPTAPKMLPTNMLLVEGLPQHTYDWNDDKRKKDRLRPSELTVGPDPNQTAYISEGLKRSDSEQPHVIHPQPDDRSRNRYPDE